MIIKQVREYLYKEYTCDVIFLPFKGDNEKSCKLGDSKIQKRNKGNRSINCFCFLFILSIKFLMAVFLNLEI